MTEFDLQAGEMFTASTLVVEDYFVAMTTTQEVEEQKLKEDKQWFEEAEYQKFKEEEQSLEEAKAEQLHTILKCTLL
jgi:hypothetical protein